MRAPISIIIPTLNAQHTLPDCLSALMEGVRAELICEVVVTDGGSTDATYQIAEAWGATFVSGPASRGGQLARGCVHSRGAWLFVLHADTQLLPGWTEGVRAHLSTKDAGWCRLCFDKGGAVVAAWANLRSRFGLPYGDQGLLLPRGLYQAVGGYKDIPLMEDVSMARALRGRLRSMDATAVTSAEKYRQQGWIRRGARNLLTLLRYFAGADPDSLDRTYRSAK